MGNQIVISCGRDKEQIVWGRSKGLTINIVFGVSGEKQKNFAVVVNVVEVNVLLRALDALVGNLTDMIADLLLKHMRYPLLLSCVYLTPRKVQNARMKIKNAIYDKNLL